MSVLDTTEYFRSTYTHKYIPFESNNHNKHNEYNGWRNFCPRCHYNYNSHYHKAHCENQVPIGDGIIPLLIMLFIYYLSKNYKSWKK